jgi:hypothetical protein
VQEKPLLSTCVGLVYVDRDWPSRLAELVQYHLTSQAVVVAAVEYIADF